MYKYLFFDDVYLFRRENLKREYGIPEIQKDSVYCDGKISTTYPGVWTFRLDDGRVRMLYTGKRKDGTAMGVFSAIGNDFINFEPENLKPGSEVPNEVMTLGAGCEVLVIVEDKLNGSGERYKLLMTQADFNRYDMEHDLYVSADLLNWRKVEGVHWGSGAEPIGGAFYNVRKQCFTIILRPYWGIRAAGYMETKDWRSYSDYSLCLTADSSDGKLEEIYGMPAFEYDGTYIGFPHFYSDFGDTLETKYSSGKMKAQIAYSRDGNCWQRALRETFLGGEKPHPAAHPDFDAPMIWPSSIIRDGENIYIYATASLLQHGPAFSEEGLNGRIVIYKLRKDGFICLASEGSGKSIVATRENAWNSGELHVNMQANNATVAIYCSGGGGSGEGNRLGTQKPIAGYGHEDCIPFSGDSCDFIPKYKSGKTIDALKGKTLVFEIAFENGKIYSISGDTAPLFNVPAAKYRKTGVVPETFI